jgi:hypothetical protein
MRLLLLGLILLFVSVVSARLRAAYPLMFFPEAQLKVWLHTQLTDMRKACRRW